MTKKIQRLAVVGVAAGSVALAAPTMAMAGTASPAEHSVVAHSVSMNDGWGHGGGFGFRHDGFGFRHGGFEHRHFGFGHRHFGFEHRHFGFEHRHFGFGHRHFGFEHGGFGHRGFGFDRGGVFFKKSVSFAGPGGAFSSTVVSGAR